MNNDTLFLQYIDALDRGESPSITGYCARADDPNALRDSIALHSSIGMRLGRFQIVEELGHGGYGSVFPGEG